MARSVYKICACKDPVKCRHPWWFSYKRTGLPRVRKSLDVVLETHVDSKTVAEEEAERLRIGIVDDTLPARPRELLGLPAAAKPQLANLTIAQLLKVYEERQITRSATAQRQRYQIGTVSRTVLPRPAGGEAPLGEWLVADVTADTLERLRDLRVVGNVRPRAKGSHRVGGQVAANRDLRLLRAAFNWALRTGYVERTPFKRGNVSSVTLTKEIARSRRLQAGELERLFAACELHLRGVMEAALETGCRKGELLSLQWSQVTLESRPELWLPADKTKTGKARRVPISTRLRTLLEMRRDALRTAIGLKPDEPLSGQLHVFGNELGQRVGTFQTAWRRTCERAGIHDLHFHDLRREAGSRWMDAGVPLATIQRWLGHTNIAQTSTYLAASAAGEHEAMRRFEEAEGRLTPIDTGGETPPPERPSSAETEKSKTQENLTKH